MSSSRLALWRDMMMSMHPAAWLWGWIHRRPTPLRFDLLYKLGGGDPWRVENAPYEERKRADTLSLLRPRYEAILDVGCGTGVLTRLLAERGPVLGLDGSREAIKRAERVRDSRITYVVGDLCTFPLESRYELVMASEVLYYLKDSQRRNVLNRLADALVAGGQMVIVGSRQDVKISPLIDGRSDLKLAGDIVREGDVWRPYRIVLIEKEN